MNFDVIIDKKIVIKLEKFQETRKFINNKQVSNTSYWKR